MRDPFDGAVVICGIATAVYAALIAILGFTEVVHLLVSAWPVLATASLLAWLLIEALAPLTPAHARRTQLIVLVGIVLLEATAAAPIVALCWEFGGAQLVAGAALITCACFSALTVYAIAKPALHLEVFDPLVVLAILGGTTILFALGLGLPLRFFWGAVAIWLTTLFILRDICIAHGHVTKGRRVAAATRLFIGLNVLFVELTAYFAHLAVMR